MNLKQMNLTSRKFKNKIKKFRDGIGFIYIYIMGNKIPMFPQQNSGTCIMKTFS